MLAPLTYVRTVAVFVRLAVIQIALKRPTTAKLLLTNRIFADRFVDFESGYNGRASALKETGPDE